MTVLPGIEIVDLPSLDAEVPCTITIDDEPPCPSPAVWRLLARCPACDLQGVETVCQGHHEVAVARGMGRTMTTSCCAAVMEARWERL